MWGVRHSSILSVDLPSFVCFKNKHHWHQTNCLRVLPCTDCVLRIAADWSIIYSQFDSIVHQLKILPQSHLRISHHLWSTRDRFDVMVFMCYKPGLSKYISFIIFILWNPDKCTVMWEKWLHVLPDIKRRNYRCHFLIDRMVLKFPQQGLFTANWFLPT